MKGKQLFLLLVLCAALGAAWYFLSARNRATWSESGGGGGKVVEFPINDVARLTIKSSAGEVNLVKKGDEWTVQERADYPASFEQVSTLLRKLWELKTVQEVKIGPSQFARIELVEPGQGEKAGTLVELKDKDGKPLNALLLGKKHLRKTEGGEMDFGGPGGFPTGRYVKPVANAKVSLVSETLDEAEPKPERWLTKDFIKIEGPKSIAVTGPQTWTVTRETATAEWKLADAKPDEKLDAGKTSSLGTVFSSPTFDDVLAPEAKLEDPLTTATIETFDGFRYALKIGKANGENHPVLIAVGADILKARTPGKDEKPEDKTRLDGEFALKQKEHEEKLAKEKKFEGRAYLVPKFAVDSLLKDRAALLADKPPEPPSAATPPAAAVIPPVSVTTPPMPAPMPAAPPTAPAPQTPSAPEKPAPRDAATPPSPSPEQPQPVPPAAK